MSLVAKVSRVTKDAVYVDDYKDPVHFDYLVLATGVSHKMLSLRPHEHTIDTMLNEAKKTYKQIEEVCTHVLAVSHSTGCGFSASG